MLRRKSRRHQEAKTLAAFVAEVRRLDYGGGYARELQSRQGELPEASTRVPPPRRPLRAEWYYEF